MGRAQPCQFAYGGLAGTGALWISNVTNSGTLHTLANASLNDDIRNRIRALDIDLSCALRFSRIALQALASASDEARESTRKGA